MIAKSIKAKSFAGCVNYVMKKDAEVLKAEGVMALDAKSIIDSFEFQRSGRPEIKSPVGHIPISFAPEDRDKMSNDPDRLQTHYPLQHRESQPAQEPQSEQRQEQTNDDGGGVLSIFNMPSPSSEADQDDIDNAEMAKNLPQKKKRRGMRM